MTIFGWDASDYDWDRGPMDLAAAEAAGIRFFTHKATEGTSVRHVHFGEAMRRARDAGIPVLGAYHVVRSPRNAQAEVSYFFGYLDQQAPWWRTHPAFFIQVDLEKWPYDAVPAVEGEDFADLAQAQSGKVAIIYASKGQYQNDLTGTSHELWNANYPLSYQTGTFLELYRRAGGDNGPGWASYSGKTPKIWQYTSSAVIGRQPTCDANAFRGSLAELKALIGGDDMLRDEIIPGTSTPGMSDRDAATLIKDMWYVLMLGRTAGGGLWGDSPFAALLKAASQSGVVALADAQLAALAEQIGTHLVVNPDTPLGDADKPAIVAAVKEALRQGVAS